MSDSNLIPVTDLAAPATPAIENPLRWDNEPVAQGVFLGVQDSESALDLLGTPAMSLPEPPRLPEDFAPSAELQLWHQALLDALAAAAAGAAGKCLTMDGLSNADRIAVDQILSSGEVDGSVHLDGVSYEISEATLHGVWRIIGDDGSDYVEVARIPGVIAEAAASLRSAPLRIPQPAEGVMNAPALLSEISDRAARYATGDISEPQNHVINFTLLPITEADQNMLLNVLGRAELRLSSGGFGDCHILATQVRHVWAVQYVNAMDHTILDTIEIGDIPTAALAATEDFEDSMSRLQDITEAYF